MVIDQGPGIVHQHLPGDTAKVPKGPFQATQPGRLALMAEGLDIQAAGISQGGHEQMHCDRLPADPDPTLAEVDLQLAARFGLETYRGASLGPQLLAQRCHGAFHRAQRHRHPQLVEQLLADHRRIAPVLPETLGQPRLQPRQLASPGGCLVGTPATLAQVTAHRVPAHPQIHRDPPRPPASAMQGQHRLDFFRQLHLHLPSHPILGPEGTS